MEAKLIEIVEILAPDRFLIKEYNSLEEIRKISEEIENYLFSASDVTCIEIGDPGCCFFKGLYHRVNVADLIGTHNIMAKCTFIDCDYPMTSILKAKIKKLPEDLIGRPKLIKEVKLLGIIPHSILIDHNLRLEFGPARNYDESAATFVKNVVSRSTVWLCVADHLAFKSLSSFDVNLYYIDEVNNGTLSNKTLLGYFDHGLSVDLCEVNGWVEDYGQMMWSSLNCNLVEMKFASLKQEFENSYKISSGEVGITPGQRDVTNAAISPFHDRLTMSRTFKTSKLSKIESSTGKISKLYESFPLESIKSSVSKYSVNKSNMLNFVSEFQQLCRVENNLQNDLKLTIEPDKLNFHEIIKNSTMKSTTSQPSDHNKIVEFCTESPLTPQMNPQHMKHKPRSQMIFGRGKHDVLIPCSVNNKVSPHDPVLLDSLCGINQMLDIEQSEFYQFMKKDKNFSTVATPTSLQSYAWPAILKLYDFFGVGPSPSRSPENLCGGKTAAYIFPILSQINNTACYSALSQSSESPIVIIVSPSSKHVLSIYSQISSLLSHQMDLPNKSLNLSVSYLFGKSNESKYDRRRRSQIFVTTPNCLLRMYDIGVISFDNLCHLIFEEADVLIDDFEMQVERIIDGFHLSVNSRKSRSVPKQVLVFSQHWTPGLDCFVTTHLTCPTVVIANKMEAFYSSGVKTEVRTCLASSKPIILQEVVCQQLSNDNKTNVSQKIVIICSQDVDARKAYKQLNQHYRGSHLMLVNCSIEDERLFNIKQTFHETLTDVILVTSDDMLLSLSEMSESTCVIHLDIPKKQQTLASRLWLMRDHFQKTSERAKHVKVDESKQVNNILLLLEENNSSSHLCNLAVFLKRAGISSLPNELERVLIRSNNNQEAALCSSFKSFGFCRNRRCKHRHNFNQHLDVDICRGIFLNISFHCIVKIKVTSVRSPFVYEAQVLEWVEQGKNSQPIQNIQSKLLAIQLARKFGLQGNRRIFPENLNCNRLYAWKTESGLTFRAKIVSLEHGKIPDVVHIYLVDFGEEYEVKVDELFDLPESLEAMPHQLVEIHICRLKTVDNDASWNNQDRLFVERILGKSIFRGRIVFKVGNKLWLDPLEECKKLCNLGMWSSTLDVRKVMLEGGVAEQNSDHIRLLLNASGDLHDLPKFLKSKNFGFLCRGQFVSTCVEILTDQFTPVYLSGVENAHKFFVRKTINEERLEQLHAEIEKHVKDTNEVGLSQLTEDMLVLVKSFCGWRRAKVMECLDDGKVKVFYLDFGFSDFHERPDIFPMSMKVKDALPFQAIECTFSCLESCIAIRRSIEESKLLDSLKNVGSPITVTSTEDVIDKKMLHIRTNGTRVDAMCYSDDDENEGCDDERVAVDKKMDTPAHTFSEPRFHPPRISDYLASQGSSQFILGQQDCVMDFMLNMMRSDKGPKLLTAGLIDSKVTELGTSFVVHLHSYDMGEFVIDLEQMMVLESVVSLTEHAVKDIFNSITSCDGTHANDDNVDLTKEIFKKKCIKFLVEKNMNSLKDLAENIYSDLNLFLTSQSLEGLTGMLCLVMKFNTHWSSFEPIMKALTTLFEYFPGHCEEARQGYLWDSICFHLYNKMESPEYIEGQVMILRGMKKLLNCRLCCKEFIDRGGITGVCRLIRNVLQNHNHMVWSLDLLQHLIQCVDITENIHPIRRHIDDDESGDDNISPVDMKIFDILSIKDQDAGGDGEMMMMSDPNKMTRLIKSHRQLNMDCKAVLRNVERNAQADLLECMEVVSIIMKQGSRGTLTTTAMLLLGRILEQDVGNVILKLKENEIVDGIFDILEEDGDFELLNTLLSLVQIMMGRRISITKYIFNYGRHHILQEIHSKSYGQIKQISYELLQAFPNKCDTMKSDDIGVKKIMMTSKRDLKRSIPTIYWSDVGTKLKLRVEARQIVPDSLEVYHSDHSVLFKACSETQEYTFDLELSDPIIPSECDSFVRSSEVVLMLAKSSKHETWTRLVRKKRSFIKPDLDDLERRVKDEDMKEVDLELSTVTRVSTISDDEDWLDDENVDDDDDDDDRYN